MAVTSITYAGTVGSVDRAGGQAWGSPTNAQGTSDTTVTLPGASGATDYLVCTNYNFTATIPANSVIQGVLLTFRASETGSSGLAAVAQLVSAATPTLIGTAKTQAANAISGATLADFTLGGSADKWGATLTAAIVNSSGFGVAIWHDDTVNILSIDSVALTITYEAPIAITSGLGELTLTGQIPTAEVASGLVPIEITAELGELSLTGFAPTVALSDRLRVSWVELEIPAAEITTGLGALTLTGYEPTALTGGSIAITSELGELVLTGYEPTAQATASGAIITELGELTLGGLAPDVFMPRLRVSWAQLEIPAAEIATGLGELALTGYEPTAQIGGGTSPNITTSFGELTLAGLAPDVRVPVRVTTDVGALTLIGYAPTVDVSTIGASANIPTGLGALTLTGYAPTLTGSYVARPGVGSLTLTGFEPAVTDSGVVQRLRVSWVELQTPAVTAWNVYPGAGALTFTGQVPTVQIGGVSPNIVTGFGELLLTGQQPTAVVFGTERLRVSWVELSTPAVSALSITPNYGELTFTGHAPTINNVGNSANITPGAGELVFTGFAPDETYTLPTPLPGVLTLAGFAPSLGLGVYPGAGSLTLDGKSGSADMTPPPNFSVFPSEGDLVLEGHAPAIRQDITIPTGVGALAFVGQAPAVGSQIVVGVGALELAGLAPTLTQTYNEFATDCGTGELVLTGHAPTTMHGGSWAITPGVGSLVLTGQLGSVVNSGDIVVEDRNAGGWPIWNPPTRRKKEIDEERERLGILPRTVQKALTRAATLVVDKVATDDEALSLAQQIVEQQQIEQVQAAVRAELQRARIRWKSSYEFIVQALILQRLQEEAQRQYAERLRLEQEEREYLEFMEAAEVAEVFLNWL